MKIYNNSSHVHACKPEGYGVILMMTFLAAATISASLLYYTMSRDTGQEKKQTIDMIKEVKQSLLTYYWDVGHFPTVAEGGLNALLKKPTFDPNLIRQMMEFKTEYGFDAQKTQISWKGPYLLKQYLKDANGYPICYQNKGENMEVGFKFKEEHFTAVPSRPGKTAQIPKVVIWTDTQKPCSNAGSYDDTLGSGHLVIPVIPNWRDFVYDTKSRLKELMFATSKIDLTIARLRDPVFLSSSNRKKYAAQRVYNESSRNMSRGSVKDALGNYFLWNDEERFFYSIGPDRIDDGGRGDDIAANSVEKVRISLEWQAQQWDKRTPPILDLYLKVPYTEQVWYDILPADMQVITGRPDHPDSQYVYWGNTTYPGLFRQPASLSNKPGKFSGDPAVGWHKDMEVNKTGDVAEDHVAPLNENNWYEENIYLDYETTDDGPVIPGAGEYEVRAGVFKYGTHLENGQAVDNEVINYRLTVWQEFSVTQTKGTLHKAYRKEDLSGFFCEQHSKATFKDLMGTDRCKKCLEGAKECRRQFGDRYEFFQDEVDVPIDRKNKYLADNGTVLTPPIEQTTAAISDNIENNTTLLHTFRFSLDHFRPYWDKSSIAFMKRSVDGTSIKIAWEPPNNGELYLFIRCDKLNTLRADLCPDSFYHYTPLSAADLSNKNYTFTGLQHDLAYNIRLEARSPMPGDPRTIAQYRPLPEPDPDAAAQKNILVRIQIPKVTLVLTGASWERRIRGTIRVTDFGGAEIGRYTLPSIRATEANFKILLTAGQHLRTAPGSEDKIYINLDSDLFGFKILGFWVSLPANDLIPESSGEKLVLGSNLGVMPYRGGAYEWPTVGLLGIGPKVEPIELTLIPSKPGDPPPVDCPIQDGQNESTLIEPVHEDLVGEHWDETSWNNQPEGHKCIGWSFPIENIRAPRVLDTRFYASYTDGNFVNTAGFKVSLQQSETRGVAHVVTYCQTNVLSESAPCTGAESSDAFTFTTSPAWYSPNGLRDIGSAGKYKVCIHAGKATANPLVLAEPQTKHCRAVQTFDPVVLYADANQGGAQLKYWSTQGNSVSPGGWNDRISSIVIPTGYTLWVSDGNACETHYTWSAQTINNLGNYAGDKNPWWFCSTRTMNDAITHIKITATPF
ncbi:type II secretion system protein GspG [Deltaproteobacteria bacterium TL4]